METHEQFPVFVIDDGARSFVRLEFCLLNFPMGDLMSHTPWSQEDAEKWAKEARLREEINHLVDKAAFDLGFKLALAKAAEVIEACETVYQHIQPDIWCEIPYDEPGLSKHSAKLVGVRKIEDEK